MSLDLGNIGGSGIGAGGIVNSAANISSRKSDKGKSSESSLYEFLNTVSDMGIQIKANFEVEFLQMDGLQFFCQSVSIPGLKSNNTELFYKGRSIQIPINTEQEHEFQMTVINDGNGKLYAKFRHMMIYDYYDTLVRSTKKVGDNGESRRLLNNGYTMRVKARGDSQNYAGMNIVLKGVRITGVSGIDFSHTDSNPQTFTVDGYSIFVDLEIGDIKKKDGLLGKVDKISNKISNVLGK